MADVEALYVCEPQFAADGRGIFFVSGSSVYHVDKPGNQPQEICCHDASVMGLAVLSHEEKIVAEYLKNEMADLSEDSLPTYYHVVVSASEERLVATVVVTEKTAEGYFKVKRTGTIANIAGGGRILDLCVGATDYLLLSLHLPSAMTHLILLDELSFRRQYEALDELLEFSVSELGANVIPLMSAMQSNRALLLVNSLDERGAGNSPQKKTRVAGVESLIYIKRNTAECEISRFKTTRKYTAIACDADSGICLGADNGALFWSQIVEDDETREKKIDHEVRVHWHNNGISGLKLAEDGSTYSGGEQSRLICWDAEYKRARNWCLGDGSILRITPPRKSGSPYVLLTTSTNKIFLVNTSMGRVPRAPAVVGMPIPVIYPTKLTELVSAYRLYRKLPILTFLANDNGQIRNIAGFKSSDGPFSIALSTFHTSVARVCAQDLGVRIFNSPGAKFASSVFVPYKKHSWCRPESADGQPQLLYNTACTISAIAAFTDECLIVLASSLGKPDSLDRVHTMQLVHVSKPRSQVVAEMSLPYHVVAIEVDSTPLHFITVYETGFVTQSVIEKTADQYVSTVHAPLPSQMIRVIARKQLDLPENGRLTAKACRTTMKETILTIFSV